MYRDPRSRRVTLLVTALAIGTGAFDARADDLPGPGSAAQDQGQKQAHREAPRYQAVVRGPPPRSSPSSTVVTAEEARRLPGTQDDALKVVEDLPGVARPALGSGQIVVWGANPSDTRVLVDGVEVPRLYHGGLRSVLDSDLVGTVELVPGGYGADHGRAIGGMVLVGTRRLPDDGVHGHIAVDLLDASALLSAALGPRLRIAVAGRYGYFDRLAEAIAPGAALSFPIPGYDDYQVKLTLALRPGEDLAAVFLGSNDRQRRTQPSSDPAAVRSDAVDSSFYRVYLRYAARPSSETSVTVTPYFGVDRNRSDLAYGGPPARLVEDTYLYGLRAAYRAQLVERATFTAGLDLVGRRSSWSRSGSLSIPPREGDPYVFGRPPGADVNTDDWTTHVADFAPYAAVDIRLGPVTIAPGVRLDAFLMEGSRQTPRLGGTPSVGFTRIAWALDPRLAIEWRPVDRLSLFASGGLYHQPPDGADLSAVFGNPTLGPARAAHVTGGASISITSRLSAELTAYYRYLDQQVSRSALGTPALAGALTQDGAGWSYGGQLVVRQELWRNLSGWVTYALGRSQRLDHPGAAQRPSDYDQTHLLTLVASYERRCWGFGLRLRYATGTPRTPVVGSFYDARDDAWQPVFGATNRSRLPDFVQLDLRLERRFDLHRAALRIYLDVQNVTYQKNPEEVVYNFDYSRRSYITGLPTLGVLGARLEF